MLENVPIVREFPDVFPIELPGIPPDQEIKFVIGLIPGIADFKGSLSDDTD